MRMRGLWAIAAAVPSCFGDAPPIEDGGTSTSSVATGSSDGGTGSTTDGGSTTDADTTATATSLATTGDTSTGTDPTVDTSGTGVDCVHRVFTTKGTFLGAEVGGGLNAQALCEGEAQDAGLDGTWEAVLSDQQGPAVAHLELCGDIVLANDGDGAPDDTLVATQAEWWGDHVHAIDRHADGMPIPLDNMAGAWTGSNPDGTVHADDCADWGTSNPEVTGRWGWAVDNGMSWISDGSLACSSRLRLYCLEQF